MSLGKVNLFMAAFFMFFNLFLFDIFKSINFYRIYFLAVFTLF